MGAESACGTGGCQSSGPYEGKDLKAEPKICGLCRLRKGREQSLVVLDIVLEMSTNVLILSTNGNRFLLSIGGNTLGTKKNTKSIARTLFGSTRRGILGLLLLHPHQSYYVRQIVRLADVSPGAVNRELRKLEKAGIITREQQGRQIHYRANTDCPVFDELRSLLTKTTGLADVLRDALAQLEENIKAAFVYGSLASGEMDAQSDVDLMVVGNVPFGEVVLHLQGAQEQLAREINPTVYPPEEFREKLAAKHHFLTQVMEGPKVFVVGDENDLRALGEQRLAEEA